MVVVVRHGTCRVARFLLVGRCGVVEDRPQTVMTISLAVRPGHGPEG